MDATTPLTPEAQRKQDRARKRKAILAGGVVLGLGAAVTLAAWSDDVFAEGTFNTGSFELQGAADAAGTVFQDYDNDGDPANGPASLAFQLEAAEMAPSQTVYAPITIGTSDETSLAGTFTLSEVSAAGSYDDVLTYRIFAEDAHAANCSPAGADNLDTADLWSGGDDVDTMTLSSGDALAVGANNGAPVQHLCIAVTMGDAGADAATNQTAVEEATTGVEADDATTVTWVFNGQSTDA